MAANFVRVFAIMLALTGFSATTYTAPTGAPGSSKVSADGITGTPVAQCNPNDPPSCGLD